ncbi:phosphatase PAP2 family protein [Polyangium sp. y55x31]|uniref:phosphatase PAP2 family protein n=1 Tax=Polyangium sp. y55x31 TaxID=3042688 RepID=UPI0024823687|nr:phosphatase PAP2 family protein [Polyangium sp. y55x31]MDI1479224.1 phosphatase PAP2 family protein [Polyangium sp. y55x31]
MKLRPTGDGSRWAWASLGGAPLLLLWIHATLGLRPEHFVIVGLFVVLAWAGPRARRFAAIAAPFVLTGLAYDHLRLFIHLRGEVHVGDLHEAERALFGVSTSAGRVPISELVARATHTALDALTGIVYLLYLIQVFAVGAYLYFRDQERMQRLSWGFAAASLLGWMIWIVWPAAPPWYVDLYGAGPAVLDAPSNPAGGARFDALFGVNVFHAFYARSSNVFGAMPSLHVGYAVLPALATWSLGGRLRVFTALWAAVMAFSAMYLRHHYILDILAGAAVALAADRAVLLAQRARLDPAPSKDGASPEVSV